MSLEEENKICIEGDKIISLNGETHISVDTVNRNYECKMRVGQSVFKVTITIEKIEDYPCSTCCYRKHCTWTNPDNDCVYHSLAEEDVECP